MNRRRFVLLLLLAWSGSLCAAPPATPQAAFDEANRLYELGRYEPALALYRQAAARMNDWKIHFNSGNCEYKLGRYLDAKIDYLRARKLNSEDGDIDSNLALVNRRFRDSIPPVPPDFPVRLGLWLQNALPVNLVNLALLALGWMAAIFLLRLMRGGFRRRWLYGLGASLLLLAVLAAVQAHRLARLHTAGTAVVRVEQAELRSGPGDEQTVFFEVHAGLEVTVREQRRDWLYVTASDQVAGWIERSNLQLI
jgi:tetratricopeptide (TPR) repeat protein